jgi:hypothetical protein
MKSVNVVFSLVADRMPNIKSRSPRCFERQENGKLLWGQKMPSKMVTQYGGTPTHFFAKDKRIE